MCLLVHKASVGQASVYMSDMLNACSVVPPLTTQSSSSSGDYMVPGTVCKLGVRAFSVSGPLSWNALPNDTKSAESTDSFKRLLKTHLFKVASLPVASLNVGGAQNRHVLSPLLRAMASYQFFAI